MRLDPSLFRIRTKILGTNNPLEHLRDGLLELANLLPDAVVIYQDEYIEYINPAGLEMIGADDPSEVIGMHISELSEDPQSIALSDEREKLLMQGENLSSAEFKIKRLDGEEIIVETRSSLVEYKGKPAVLTISRDITENKIKEENTNELIKRNNELDSFAHTVAHNLKNDLGVLMGYSSLLEKQMADGHEDHANAVQEIARTSMKMSSTIDELLLLASVRSKRELTIQNLDMETILNEAINRLRFTIEENQVELIMPTEWPRVIGHGPWLEEIWVNYISNAIKYGGDPPVIEFGATRSEFNGIPIVTYWVKDNGRGLSQFEQDKLFKPFTQLNPASLKGHGLGLSIVKRIAEKLNGQVGVESSGIDGEGSKFYITLPTDLR